MPLIMMMRYEWKCHGWMHQHTLSTGLRVYLCVQFAMQSRSNQRLPVVAREEAASAVAIEALIDYGDVGGDAQFADESCDEKERGRNIADQYIILLGFDLHQDQD